MAVNNKRPRGIGIYLVILLAIMLGASYVFTMDNNTQTRTYQEILGYFENNQVQSYSLDFGTSTLVINPRVPAGEPAAPPEGQQLSPTDQLRETMKNQVVYKVPSVLYFIEYTEPIVRKHNEGLDVNSPEYVKWDYIRAQETPWWVSILPTLLLIGVMVVFWVLMMRQAGGGAGKAMSFAKMKVKSDDGRRTTFDDVAGAEEEKEELAEVVEFLKDPRRFNELGARIPKGVLLVGPPGTGKTLLARAVAGEAGVPFFSISGSDFVEMFVGVGASRVRDLFEQAKKGSPSIIFIDEIDAVGRQRGAGLGGGHDEREQTLNQLLVEMDGFGANMGVIVMAATNRADILDHALLRPGRFDRQIYVGLPDVRGREDILKVHMRGKPIGPDVDLRTIARTTVGFTGADLENLTNEAALLAARRHKKAITMLEIEEATIKVVAGPEKKSHKVTEHDKKLTAYHEAGHAIAHYSLPSQDPVHQVSIIPRGMAGGYTMALPIEDEAYKSKKWMQENIVTLLGGRVAEKLVLDDISTGASNDIERATKTARNMVTRYGFSDKLGPIVYGTDQSEVFLGRDFGQTRNYSENVAAEIDSEIRTIIDNAYEECKKILNEQMDKLHKVASYLMKYEKIDGEVFKRLMEDESFPDEEHERQMEARAEEVRKVEEAKREVAQKEREQRLAAQKNQDPKAPNQNNSTLLWEDNAEKPEVKPGSGPEGDKKNPWKEPKWPNSSNLDGKANPPEEPGKDQAKTEETPPTAPEDSEDNPEEKK